MSLLLGVINLLLNQSSREAITTPILQLDNIHSLTERTDINTIIRRPHDSFTRKVIYRSLFEVCHLDVKDII